MALTTTTTTTVSKGYTIFVTYGFSGGTYDSGIKKSLGYSSPINCNYIQSRVVDTLTNKNVNLYFSSASQFKFLADNNATNGTGWTATGIYGLVQIVNNNNFAKLADVVPQSNLWKKYDITDQIVGLDIITKAAMSGTSFLMPLNTYASKPYYTLNYLNYPVKTLPDIMAFGEETFFMGNVETEIQAIAYTTDITINLPLNQFNSSTNATWDGVSVVQISEVGVYDAYGNLVAIGKLNDPIGKDSTIARTIVFGVDF